MPRIRLSAIRQPRFIAPALLCLSLYAARTLHAQRPDGPAPREWSTSQPDATLPDAPSFVQTATAPEQAAPVAGTASISGTVSDIQGGFVPGATVEIDERNTQRKLTVTSGSDGRFSFSHLPPGEYHLQIAATGLARFEPPAILLKDGEAYELPEIALPLASSQTVDVFLTREEVAQQEIHDEEKQRTLGVFPNFYTSYLWNAAPLNARQKIELSAHSVFDPVTFATVAIIAGVQSERGTYPSYGTGFPGYATRYGAQFGNQFIGYFLGRAVLPAVFHQDPRYFYMGTGTGKQRLFHALSSAVLCRSDNSTRYQFCYSHIAGNLAAGAVSNAYHPAGERGLGLTFGQAFIGIGAGAGTNLIREFVIKRFTTHVPSYGKGKPEEEQDTRHGTVKKVAEP